MALDLTDKSGNGNTLTNNNGATEITTDMFFAASTKAADLEAGSSQYFSASDSASLSPTGDFTFEQWVKFESLPADGNSMFFFAKRGGAGARGFRFRILNTAGTYTLVLTISSDGTAETEKSVTWAPSTGTKYHLAVAYDASAGTADFYVNGAQQGTQQSGLPTSIFDNAADFEVGSQGGSNLVDGVIDEIRLWSTVRSSSEIADNRSLHLTGGEAGLEAYWPLEDINTFSPQAIWFT